MTTALWTELVELGWPGIAIAEEHGGQGLGAVELAILCEELGYALAASPFLARCWPPRRSAPAARAEQQATWLPGLASGEITGALGGAGGLVRRRRRRGGHRPGRRRRRRARVMPRAPTPTSRRSTSIDPTRRAARVARRRREPLGGDDPQAGIDRATVAVAAELVGVAQRALEMTLAYVKDRRQFDTPVGAYQAVSHKCAQMLKDTEGARSATYYAAWAADAGADGPGLRRAGVAGQGRGVRRRARRDRQRDPGPRRHRLHVGGRRALALQARAGRRGAARRRPGMHRRRLAALVGARLAPAAA